MNHYTFFKRAIKKLSEESLAELWESISASCTTFNVGEEDIVNLTMKEIDYEVDQAYDLLQKCWNELDRRDYFDID